LVSPTYHLSVAACLVTAHEISAVLPRAARVDPLAALR
jgi:hypothetical protein